jgi:molybdopterin-binding protein
LQPTEEPLPPGRVYLIRDVGLHRALSFDPMLFFNELLVHLGIPTGSSDEAHASRLSVVASRSNGLTCSGHDSPGMDSFLRCQDPVFLGTAEHEAPILARMAHGYRIGEAARLLGVRVETVRRWERDGKVRTSRTTGGQREVPAEEVARLLAERRATRTAPAHTSRRNAFPGVITKVTRDKVSATVEIQAGPYRVVSLITREAADELSLKAGMEAVATVKATSVMVEVS